MVPLRRIAKGTANASGETEIVIPGPPFGQEWLLVSVIIDAPNRGSATTRIFQADQIIGIFSGSRGSNGATINLLTGESLKVEQTGMTANDETTITLSGFLLSGEPVPFEFSAAIASSVGGGGGGGAFSGLHADLSDVNADQHHTFPTGGRSDYGDGTDGDVTISVNTDLTRDMFYNTLIVNAGVVLNPKGFRIFSKISIVVNGAIRRNGGAGSPGSAGSGDFGGAGGAGGVPALTDGTLAGSPNGAGGGAGGNANGNAGAAGAAGSAINTAQLSSAGFGGAGGGSPGSAVGGAGGAAGARTTPGTVRANPLATILQVGAEKVFSAPGSGAGGGGGGGNNGGGAGGGGGGGGGSGVAGPTVFVSSRTITVNAGGSIEAKGGNGGAGGAGSGGGFTTRGGGGGGGGGAGAGGLLILIFATLTNNGTISVDGGTSGAGGAGGSGTTANGDPGGGGSGLDGTLVQIQN